jgi:hypothetical protein
MAADVNNDGSVDASDLAAWKSDFGSHVKPPTLPGDYNRDGRVDAADYTVWRDSLGNTVSYGTGADGNVNGLVDIGDFSRWQTNFGAASAVGGGAEVASTPEPSTCISAILGAALLVAWRGRWTR